MCPLCLHFPVLLLLFIIIISHQERIINIADKIILLDSGKIKEIKSKDDLGEVMELTPCCRVGGDSNE